MPAIAAARSDHVTLVGDSPEIQEVKRLVEKVGPSDAPVLLYGETGTGKEVVAHALYRTRPAGQFITVDCSALVGPLLESELFGHVKGAFTSAHTNKPGLLELANGGTAFFDEIGELPLDMQVKLLRVLQDKVLRPVGSTLTRRVNFRVIAATNRDLSKEVAQGRFREDLYYRLNVVKLHLPPLRERQGDIETLAAFFLERYGPHLSMTEETRRALLDYPWPGNVRELKNCIERMVALNSGPYLHTAELPSQIQNWARADLLENGPSPTAFSPAGQPAPAAPAAPVQPASRGAFLTIDDRIVLAVEEALAYAKGDKVLAAQLLGISRTTLYRWLKKYFAIEDSD